MFQTLNLKFENYISLLDCPYFIFNENNQVGSTFGEKLSNSIQELYNKGFQKVLVIGNDCPSLNLSILKKALVLLQTNAIVVGPNFNGGLYLIGINQNQFNIESFKNVNWQSSHTYFTFKKAFKTTVLELKSLHDLNNSVDIKNFIFNSNPSFFRNFILQYQLTSKLIITRLILIFKVYLVEIPLNKGSPVIL